MPKLASNKRSRRSPSRVDVNVEIARRTAAVDTENLVFALESKYLTCRFDLAMLKSIKQIHLDWAGKIAKTRFCIRLHIIFRRD